MNTLLFVTTLVSITTTFTLVWWILRMRRVERDRSEARVAALTAASYATLEEPSPPDSAEPGMMRAEFEEGTGARPVANVFGARSLFSDGSADRALDRPSSWTVPVMALSGAALVIVIVLIAGGMVTSTADATAVRQTSQERGPERLELVALMHERRAEVLFVTGTVVGFAEGESAGDSVNVNAIVSTFDRAGRPIGQVRTPINVDRRHSESGSGSFSASIPDGSAIGRYRVSFARGARVLSHIDRRSRAGTGAHP